MKPKRRQRCGAEPAFTLVELLVLLVVIALLITMLVPSLRNARDKARQVDCLNNLKQVGLSFKLWIPDSWDAYPMARSTNDQGTLEVANDVWRTFLVMSNELSVPGLLWCPSDERRPATSWQTLTNSNISYFIGLDADEVDPELPLSGDQYLSTGQPLIDKVLTVRSNDIPRWAPKPHPLGGNIAYSDGSARFQSDYDLQTNMTRLLTEHSGWFTNTTLRLAMPE
jgi:type II secretory pathway pseudopilin PulG